MKRLSVVGGAVVLACLMGAPLAAETKTISGEVIDVTCYTKDKTSKGADHADCAMSCAKKGGKMGVLADDGTVYVITGDYAADKNKKLLPYVAKNVTATGEVAEADGQKTIAPTKIENAGK
jgi:uncharacterized protein YjhX (UPF0386 family)